LEEFVPPPFVPPLEEPAPFVSPTEFPDSHMGLANRGIGTAIYDLMVYKLDKKNLPPTSHILYSKKMEARQQYVRLKALLSIKSEQYADWFEEEFPPGEEGDREMQSRARFLARRIVEFRDNGVGE
jgi:hypothetical protein